MNIGNKIHIVKTTWFTGTPFMWKDFKFNGGQCYNSYRFLCLLILIYE